MPSIELWKPVVGWELLYEVSDMGNVRSLVRMGMPKGDSLFSRVYGGNQLKPILKKGTGYLCVTLRKPGTATQVGIHRIVLEAFVGPSNGMQACHNNGDKTDNRLANLRWDTAAGNAADRQIHGTNLAGEQNPFAKLTATDVLAIRASSEKQQALADKYGVTQVAISRIKLRKVWAHL